METPGGALFIPDRAVPVFDRRPVSRNTHYRLTDEEAELIKCVDMTGILEEYLNRTLIS
jgi:hypothetical protein